METEKDARKKGGKMTPEERLSTINRLMVDGYGIPYLFDGRVNTEDDFDIKFESDRHWDCFCWCLRNELDVFSDEVFRNITNAMRELCEEGTKLSLPRGWMGKEV
jgi:hypothetical protein